MEGKYDNLHPCTILTTKLGYARQLRELDPGPQMKSLRSLAGKVFLVYGLALLWPAPYDGPLPLLIRRLATP